MSAVRIIAVVVILAALVLTHSEAKRSNGGGRKGGGRRHSGGRNSLQLGSNQMGKHGKEQRKPQKSDGVEGNVVSKDSNGAAHNKRHRGGTGRRHRTNRHKTTTPTHPTPGPGLHIMT